ncbi:N-acetylmuramoyl-L-alanine amidase [Acetobacterium wieringae]|uniref:N-acetylmuramoyl-L-alanine amidase LytC n=1 Tax=Acetobacterium wieringae TaxID=52694 RepID=A0A1F2PCQ2_9FIRM|nr:N-acetylmuramoyl-L-alanine amidase [Acetobacterium wieringae]OFV69189.1 N-acetylmuramoyl-L-alanine amidase LytC precursor [Acetobacterium wieringae]
MNLEIGTMGTAVAQLQRDLNFCAYDAGTVDGDFGRKTEDAVLALQAYHGLEKDGIYGDHSDATLMGEIRLIQEALIKNGYRLTVDGAVGSETLAAITDFQKRNGLAVDGIVGNETLKALGIEIPLAANQTEATTPISKPTPTTPPNGTGNGQLVCINPGHGGSDPGACGNLQEKDMNLVVSLRLGQLLKERGFSVVYTRTDDRWMALSDRPVIANENNADIFVSIHHNGSASPESSGTLVICYPGSTNGLRLAQLVLNGMCNRMGLANRGIIQRDDSDVTYSDMPAIITEGLFASSPSDCHFFNNGGAELEAQGILEGILAYFNS